VACRSTKRCLPDRQSGRSGKRASFVPSPFPLGGRQVLNSTSHSHNRKLLGSAPARGERRREHVRQQASICLTLAPGCQCHPGIRTRPDLAPDPWLLSSFCLDGGWDIRRSFVVSVIAAPPARLDSSRPALHSYILPYLASRRKHTSCHCTSFHRLLYRTAQYWMHWWLSLRPRSSFRP
jgi:hypothetical protein